jgi:hypothetical protein
MDGEGGDGKVGCEKAKAGISSQPLSVSGMT